MSEGKKRRRPPLSCTSCRVKKIKCDREKPICGKCASLNTECTYVTPSFSSNKKKQQNISNYQVSISQVDTGKSSFHKIKPITILPENQIKINFHNNNTTNNTTNNDIVKSDIGISSVESTISSVDNSIFSNIGNEIDIVDIGINEKKRKRKQIELQINQLKAQLELYNDAYDPETECVSMVLGYKGEKVDSLWSKKNLRFSALGSFLVSSIWVRDNIMKNFISSFFVVRKSQNIKTNNKRVFKNKVIDKYYPTNKLNSSNDNTYDNPIEFKFLSEQLDIKKNETEYITKDIFFKKVIQMMPPKEIVDYHVNNFFKTIYPLIPILDEIIFKEEIFKIIQFPNNELESINIIIDTKIDYIRICILLLILRMSFSQKIIEKNFSKKIPNNLNILKYPITPSIIPLINFSLTKLNFLRKTSFEVLQLLLIYRFYQIRGCEDGDGYNGSDGPIYLGLIKSTFRTIGINLSFWNEKINNFKEIEQFVKQNFGLSLLKRGYKPFIHLWKKMRLISLELDLTHATMYGCKPQFEYKLNEERIFEVEYLLEFSNNNDLNIEKFANDRLNSFLNVSYQINDLLCKLHDYDNKPTIEEIDNQVKELIYIGDINYDLTNMNDYKNQNINLLSELNIIKSQSNIYSLVIIIQYILILHSEYLCSKDDGELIGKGRLKFQENFIKLIDNYLLISNNFLRVWEINEENYELLFLTCNDINELFDKLMMVTFFILIRLLRFQHSIKNNVDNNITNILKEYKKLYYNVLTVFRKLIYVERKLSRFWYKSLRYYAAVIDFADWFENSSTTNFQFNMNDDMNDDNNDNNNKINYFETYFNEKDCSVNVLTSININKLQEINEKFDKLQIKYKLDNNFGIEDNINDNNNNIDINYNDNDKLIENGGSNYLNNFDFCIDDNDNDNLNKEEFEFDISSFDNLFNIRDWENIGDIFNNGIDSFI